MSESQDWISTITMSAGRKAESGFGGWNPFRAASNAAKTASRTVKHATTNIVQGKPLAAAKTVGTTVKKTSADISNKLASVPVVGSGLHAAYNIFYSGPIDFAANVATGERIDRAGYNALKERVKAYQDIAPYVQTVISFAPGVGPGISGAIGAANALSKGQPISDAMIEGVRGAIPGGPMAQAAFDMAVAGIQGKPLTEVMLNGIPLDPEQKKYVIAAALAAKDIADGKPVDMAVYERGRVLLPEAGRRALDTGVAIAQGQKLQQIALAAAPEAAPVLNSLGGNTINSDAVLKAGSQHLTPEVFEGFKTGIGMLQHKATPTAVKALRDSLHGEMKKGFDVAAAVHTGSLIESAKDLAPKEQFGYYLAQGLQAAPKENRTNMLKTIQHNEDIKKGVKKAAKHIHKDSIWDKIIKFIKGE